MLCMSALFAGVVGCDGARGAEEPPAYTVVARWPHDAAAYSQGLVWHDSVFFESTGLYGRSQLRRVHPRSGTVLASVALPANRFGEGLALLHNRLYQLTWESHVAYVYVAATLAPIDSFTYAGEGWGLETNGTSLIMSDGSDSLRFMSPATHRVEHVVHVRYRDAPLSRLNELEYVAGELFANVYESDRVARIDPLTGNVRQLLDFTDLYPRDQRPPGAGVMNGIAATPSGTLMLTGKLWPVMFEVRLKGTRAP